ncbi:MAG: hypothetical protein COA78_36940 [Blastopirellula sp.]|nr:MAG: hypothetical protein COA78_36940 [Blastopirellula sp.]
MAHFECKFPYEEILPQNTEEDIVSFEQRIGYKLPSGYRQFLLEHNGIHFNQSLGVIWTKDEFEEYPICEVYGFFGITMERNNNIETLQEGYKFKDRVPKGYYAIANTPVPAQFICISLNEENYGRVYYWHTISSTAHEFEEPHTTEYLYPISSSFQGFWDNIRDLKELQIEMDIDESWR